MKAIRLGENPGLDKLQVADIADPGAPGPGRSAFRFTPTR